MQPKIDKLYDMAKDKNPLSKFEERQLRKDINNNKKLFARNRDLFAEEKRLEHCSMYAPCPICDKCLNKASHLYIRCQNCQIPICVHKFKDRVQMIKRKNFRIKVSEDVLNVLKEMGDNLDK